MEVAQHLLEQNPIEKRPREHNSAISEHHYDPGTNPEKRYRREQTPKGKQALGHDCPIRVPSFLVITQQGEVQSNDQLQKDREQKQKENEEKLIHIVVELFQRWLNRLDKLPKDKSPVPPIETMLQDYRQQLFAKDDGRVLEELFRKEAKRLSDIIGKSQEIKDLKVSKWKNEFCAQTVRYFHKGRQDESTEGDGTEEGDMEGADMERESVEGESVEGGGTGGTQRKAEAYKSKTNKHLNRLMRATHFIHLFVNALSGHRAWEVAASLFYLAMAGKLDISCESTKCLPFCRNDS